jgi:multidrug efflux pump subunit AcrB
MVVAEGLQIAMQRGKSSGDAAGKTQIPLPGVTIIGIMAFAEIGLSSDATGEFLFSLLAVIGTSLMLSWILARTVTPLFGHYLSFTALLRLLNLSGMLIKNGIILVEEIDIVRR